MLLKVIAKRNGKLFAFINNRKSNNYRKGDKEKKQKTDAKNKVKKIKSNKYTRSNRVKKKTNLIAT